MSTDLLVIWALLKFSKQNVEKAAVTRGIDLDKSKACKLYTLFVLMILNNIIY